MADAVLIQTPQEAKVLRRRKRQSAPGHAESSLRIPSCRPGLEIEYLERCFKELVHYYRHSAAGRRTSGIVHQMNGPLQVLSFHLELLEQKSQEELKYLSECPPEVAERLWTLRDYRLEKIGQFRQELENLQIQARRLIYEGIHEENQELFYLDLNQLFLHELELYLAHPFFKHQVRKRFYFHESLPSVYGYYIDFSQSFRNLVDNALEAMEEVETRELLVKTGLEDGWWGLSIGDTGIGISPEDLPGIFDPFFTTKGSLAEPRAGLGLFMVQRLLARYGVRIKVQSRPGETWIQVLLPLKPEGAGS